MPLDVSVIIPTHAPRADRLQRTLAGLRGQTFPSERWELLIVDNASPDTRVLAACDLHGLPGARIVREARLGLTYARLAGIAASRREVLVFVDDDNVLAPDYLAETAAIFERHPRLGACGGKSLPEWEVPPAAWVTEFSPCLALRDLGDTVRIGGREDGRSYPTFAPLGAGMGLRRAAAEAYVGEVRRSDRLSLTDRRGRSLASGGDNDIVLTALAAGWEVGYFPELRLVHLMPAGRLTRSYLARLHQGMARSWVQVLAQHGIRPWQRIPRWTLLPRKVKAFFHQRAWTGPAAFVRWRGACGTLEGRAELPE